MEVVLSFIRPIRQLERCQCDAFPKGTLTTCVHLIRIILREIDNMRFTVHDVCFIASNVCFVYSDEYGFFSDGFLVAE